MNPTITCVVLNPALEAAEPVRFAALFDGFVEGYTRHFSGDEAEPTTEWRARIAGKPEPQPVMRIVVAVDRADGSERVVGGLACEYYRGARCVLATYLYVSGQHRHQGHARDLLAAGQRACEGLGRVDAMLAETEWPEALPPEPFSPDEVAAARDRLHFFARLGARMVNVDYVQPRLAADKQPVSYLRLLVFPADGARPLPHDRLAAAIAAFLDEFYAALAEDTGGSAGATTLARMQSQLAARSPLTVPLPRLKLGDVAVCFHFAEPLDDPDGQKLLEHPELAKACPVFHSMETDLLSRAFRHRRLFRTVCLTKGPPEADAGVEVDIEFPERLQFRSENRVEERVWPFRRRRARAYLAATFFFDARVMIWHLTLKVASRSATDVMGWFDELDLIALTKVVDLGGDQEFVHVPAGAQDAPVALAAGIRYRLAGVVMPDIERLLVGLAGTVEAPTPRRATAPRATTVEILGWPAQGDQAFFGVRNPRTRRALCGIVTGILDFDEIDDAEAQDTLTSSVELPDALLRVQREGMIYVKGDDRAARAVAGTVGISPYLLIPHAVVLCNEWLLERFNDPQQPGTGPGTVAALARDVERLEDTLRTHWVPNPFFYPTEQALYERALAETGNLIRRGKAEDLLRKLKTGLELARERQRARFEANVAGLLGALAVLSLDPLLVDSAPALQQTVRWLAGFDPRHVGHALTIFAALLMGAAILVWKRPLGDTDRA